MINIFDNYHFNSQLLHRSLKLAGYQHLTICLEDDGFYQMMLPLLTNFLLKIQLNKVISLYSLMK